MSTRQQAPVRRDLLLLLTLLLWIVLVIVGYYYVHKPVRVNMVVPPLAALADLGFAVLFAGLAGAIGRRTLRAGALPPLERSALEFALGAGIIGLAWFLLGLLGLYHRLLTYLLLAAGAALLRRDLLAWLAGYSALRAGWRRAGSFSRALALAAAAMLFLQLLTVLAPPVRWDALAYHLQMPRLYLEAGRFYFLPEIAYWGHPQLVEMLYTLGLSFHRGESAALIGWAAGIVFLAGLFSFTNTQLARLRGEDAGVSAGWMAVAALLAGYSFRHAFSIAYTDLFSALFGLAALIAFASWLERGEDGWLYRAAVFTGLALSTKWTSGVLLLGLASATLLLRSSRSRPRSWLIASGIVVLVVSPWLIKNLAYSGNPLFPYFLETPWYDFERMSALKTPGPVLPWWQHIFLPFAMTWFGVDTARGFSTDIGPLLLLFAAPGFVRYWRAPLAKAFLLVLAFVALGIGVGGLRYGDLLQTRLYFVALPAAAVPCGWGWHWLQRQVIQGVRLRRLLGALTALVLALALWETVFEFSLRAPDRVLLGAITRQEYIERSTGDYALAMETLQTLPQSARTLMLWEPRGYYAPLDTFADVWVDRWVTDWRRYQTSGDIQATWRSAGYTHLLLFRRGIDFYGPQPGETPGPAWVVLEEMLKGLGAPSAIGTEYLLYPLD